jgi:hypothetical protein
MTNNHKKILLTKNLLNVQPILGGIYNQKKLNLALVKQILITEKDK